MRKKLLLFAVSVLGAMLIPVASADAAPFLATFRTTSPNETIVLPLWSGHTYNFIVDWGDGVTGEVTTSYDADRSHTYASPGDHQISITGSMPIWNFYRGVKTSKNNIISIDDAGDVGFGVGITDMNRMFYECSNLTSVALFDTSSATNMTYMFYKATSLTSVPLFDTSSATNMYMMFRQCESLTSVPLFDTSSVSGMGDMFGGTTSLTSVPLFDTSSATTMRNMFAGASSLTSVPHFNTSNVTSMEAAFSGTALTEVPFFDTSKVTDMRAMLAGTNITTIPQFDTSNVTNLSQLFDGASSLVSIPLLDASAATNLNWIFEGATSLTTGTLSGSTVDISYRGTSLDRDALVDVFNNLGTTSSATINVGSTPGWNDLSLADFAIAEAKGWTVIPGFDYCADGIQNQNETGIDTGGTCDFKVYQEELSDTYIGTIDIDTSGNVWAGGWQPLDMFDGSTWSYISPENSNFDGWQAQSISHDATNVYVTVGSGGGTGLNVYNGSNWTQYTTSNSGIPFDDTLGVYVASNGDLWVGSSSGGIAKFNGSTWTGYTMADGLGSNKVRVISGDSDGNIWAGTGDGVSKFDGSTWTSYGTADGLAHGGQGVRGITEGLDGTIWFGTKAGAFSFDGSTWTGYTTATSDIPNNSIREVFGSSNGKIWFATEGGLAMYDAGSWTTYSTLTLTEMPDDYVMGITEAPNGDLWVGTSDGIIVFKAYAGTGSGGEEEGGGGEETCSDGVKNQDETDVDCGGATCDACVQGDDCLENDDCETANCDTNVCGALETCADGIQNQSETGIDSGGECFEVYAGETFVDPRINDLHTAYTGDLWVGTGVGASRYDRPDWTHHNSTNTGGAFVGSIAYQVSSGSVFGVVASSEVDGNGINVYGGSTWVNQSTSNGLPFDDVAGTLVDSDGRLWVGSLTQGVRAIPQGNGTAVNLTTSNGLPSNLVRRIFQDSLGNIWFATDAGAAKYNGSTVTPYSTPQGLGHGVDGVRGITQDMDGTMWFATDNGVFQFDGSAFATYNTSNSDLLSNNVRDVMVTRNGNLWATTAAGTSAYNGTDWRSYTTDNTPMPSDLGLALAQTRDNRIWVGTEAGIIIFPDRYDTSGGSFSGIGRSQGCTLFSSLVDIYYQSTSDRTGLSALTPYTYYWDCDQKSYYFTVDGTNFTTVPDVSARQLSTETLASKSDAEEGILYWDSDLKKNMTGQVNGTVSELTAPVGTKTTLVADKTDADLGVMYWDTETRQYYIGKDDGTVGLMVDMIASGKPRTVSTPRTPVPSPCEARSYVSGLGGTCYLSDVADGVTSGSCSGGGSCQYTCDDGSWAQDSNICTP